MTAILDRADRSPQSAAAADDNRQLTKLYDSDHYTAYSEDLEFMWRWTIYHDHQLVQEGCSLTLDASKRAVNHVLAFFSASTRHHR